MPTFAILYQRIDHKVVNGRPEKETVREIEKIGYDQIRGELVTLNQVIKLASNTYYKIYPL